jgi:hypothetical protein
MPPGTRQTSLLPENSVPLKIKLPELRLLPLALLPLITLKFPNKLRKNADASDHQRTAESHELPYFLERYGIVSLQSR